MATVSGALNGRLLACVPLTTLIAARLYPGVVPQEETTPYVAFVRMDEDESDVEGMGADGDIAETGFEIMSVAGDYDTCEAVHEAVRDGLRRFRGTVNGVEVTDILLRGGEGPLFMDAPPLFEATQRVTVRYRRP